MTPCLRRNSPLPSTLVALLAFVGAAAARADDVLPRLDHAALPTFESVHLACDPAQTTYRGTAAISLDVKQATSELRFHARALTIDTATLAGPSGPVRVTAIEKLPPDQARVRLAGALAPGAYTLTLHFHNAFNTQAVALYRVVTGGRGYLFTQLEDTEAREAFPCWDEPEFKIPWQLSLTVPSADLAVSNTPGLAETRAGTMKTVVFARTKPLPSYLIAIAVGPFETVPIPGMSVPGRVITARGGSAMAAEAARVAGPLLTALERYFGRPYPYEKLDLIAAPEFQYGAMENAGAIVFAERSLLIDPRSADPDQRNTIVTTIAHEMSHMWFGDLVTMKWWDDLWLNESFASWMGTKVTDQVLPEEQEGVTSLFSVQRAFTTDSRLSTNAMREKIAGRVTLAVTANELTYSKGQAVLTMFEGWLGADKFRAGVLDYLKRFEWRNAEGSDLWRALGRQSGEDIDAAMSSFLDQPGVPQVTLEPAGGGRIKLSQRRFLTAGEETGAPQRWRIPVILRYPADGELRTLRVWLTGADTVADLGVSALPEWILPNAGASGYYRWRVADAMLDALAGPARGQLTVSERIDLISNLTAQLRAGTVHGDRFLMLIATLADDPDPQVVRAAVLALSETRLALITPRSDPYMSSYICSTFVPALHRFGLRPSPGESDAVTIMRPSLMQLLADGGRQLEVQAYAESLSRAYRRDMTSIPASLVEPAIVLGARRGDRTMYDDYRHHFESTSVPNERFLYLTGLGSFRNPELRHDALEYALKGPLRPQETLVVPAAMAIDRTGVSYRPRGSYPDEVASWVEGHWRELSSRLPPNFASRILGLTGGCSRERAKELERFFNMPEHGGIGIAPTLRRLEDAIEECSSLHDREADRVERWMLLEASAP